MKLIVIPGYYESLYTTWNLLKMHINRFFKKKKETLHPEFFVETDSPRHDSGKAETNENIIKELEIFQRLNKKQLKVLSSLVVPRSCPKGEIIIKKGSVGLGMFVITAGQMEVYEERDGAIVRLAIVKTNECVGEMSLIDELPRSANVRALDDCEYLLLTRDSFNGLVKRDPDILWGIVPIIVKRLQDSSKKLIELSQPASVNQTEPTRHVASESTTDNSTAVETEPKTQEVYDKPEIKHEDDDVEDTHKEKEDDMVSSIMQLSGASLMYLSTIHLLNVQEMFRLTIGSGPVKQRMSKSEEVVSSATTSLKENMDEKNQKLFDSFWDFVDSLTSIFKL